MGMVNFDFEAFGNFLQLGEQYNVFSKKNCIAQCYAHYNKN